eukprot:CAMPEP_0170532174 /NCGR_PEP_ID=MMETSP0209-20121228/69134_1 /TAXON_ID=665100 ORGANISM="Litonotus pictus, Strain P1" /NCGR_SAMPLE_ID=MMETSP0209 /ASSEMBLY_ACC=CAM_ASM_000301 /LENGTH=292 /DNA_ID=CAMNT_0010827907 /DNA_START=512 /DNA_END=1386 /DNA_ORIENTATION=-
MLMNLDTLQWDTSMCNIFGIPKECLPQIISSSDDFGESEDLDMKLPITGVVGDQMSACLGHCLEMHQVKNTYGTGGFLLMNTGAEKIFSNKGLLTTVLYKNRDQEVVFGLEGSIESAGNTLTWLKENLGIFNDYKELKDLFLSEKDSGDVYFVPSFSGLYSPYWNSSAKASIQGMTMNTSKGHLVRAAFEAVSLRTNDIIQSFEEDTDVKIHLLKVDGGMTNSNEFLQTQSDLANIKVNVKEESEITLLGSAVAAGIGNGIYSDVQSVSKVLEKGKVFSPKLNKEDLEIKYL